MSISGLLGRLSYSNRSKFIAVPAARTFSAAAAFSEDPQLNEFLQFMDELKNFEKSGVPKGAGTDSDDGFDLGRMRRLMELLGNPQSKFKVITFTNLPFEVFIQLSFYLLCWK